MTLPSVPDQPLDTTEPTEPKTPWIAPEIQVIAAGEAEVGTRSLGRDGAFTTS